MVRSGEASPEITGLLCAKHNILILLVLHCNTGIAARHSGHHFGGVVGEDVGTVVGPLVGLDVGEEVGDAQTGGKPFANPKIIILTFGFRNQWIIVGDRLRCVWSNFEAK